MPTIMRTRARNYVAMSPLLRKGGIHERSKSGARAEVKHEIHAEISNWLEILDEEYLSTTTHSRSDDNIKVSFNKKRHHKIFSIY